MRSKHFLVASLALAAATASASLAACASDEDGSIAPSENGVVVPSADAGGGDAGADGPGPCTADDCEWFPQACAPDTLCPNGPFDPSNPAVGMDWRTRITAIRGRGATDIWIVGAVGAAAHFDGAAWTTSDLGTTESQRVLWLPSAGELSFGAIERIYSRGIGGDAGAASIGGWSLRDKPIAPSGYNTGLTAAWASVGSSSLWIATVTDLWRLDLAPDLTFVSRPGIPSSLCELVPCRGLRSIHGATSSTLWAVGDVGASVRITGADGDTPTLTPLNARTWTGLTGVWSASDDEAWAVGGSGTVRHYTTAQGWQVIEGLPTNENLNAVWGTSPSDVWVVGNAGVVLHFDGTGWSRVKLAGLGNRRPDLYAAWSSGPGTVWIAGQGIVLALGGKP
jgi:hypothetical protein